MNTYSRFVVLAFLALVFCAMASGVYFCRLQAGDFAVTKELVLLR